MNIQTINPATEQPIQSYVPLTTADIDEGIEKAHQAFLLWRTTSFQERAKQMMIAASLLRKQQDSLTKLMAEEMGKPIRAGRAEIEKCALVCEYYAQHAEAYLAELPVKTEVKSMICYRPLGVIFAIMPWNFPFWQVFRFAAPSLMAGNVAILKHAPISTGAGKAIEQLLMASGFPEGVFQQFIIHEDQASQVIAHDKVVGITLTGSERAGRIVAAQAGAHLKRLVLELGGNDPYIVLEDADLDLAANRIVTSRLNNSGQVCIAAKRVIAVESICESLSQKIEKLVKAYQCGDPQDESTQLGPLARKDLRDSLHDQVQRSLDKGAILLTGGTLPKTVGFYYPPTILLSVKPGMPAFDEELFGPVIAIIRAKDEKTALQLANSSRYGIGAAVFTEDRTRGEWIAKNDLEAGACFVNDLVVSDPRLPFGGIKCSGFGRELGQEGLLAFMNIKSIKVA